MMPVVEQKQLEKAILSLEGQRRILGDDVVDAAIFQLRHKLVQLQKTKQKNTAIHGERKLVTIMFADISGFTALSEMMDPEEVRDLMNACFSRLVPVIEKYQGTVDKFIGDEIMALFGAPLVKEDDPSRALYASLEMIAALRKFRKEMNSSIDLHIGINTGLVIAGNIGSQGKQQYTVMGDAVNVASRLCDTAEATEIIVGPDTYKLTKKDFIFERLDPVKVKGKKEPLQIYKLLGKAAEGDQEKEKHLLRSKMVGRSKEMIILDKALENLHRGKGSRISVIGEAGIGKSRLVFEMHQIAGEEVRWVRGRALSYSSDISYMPVKEVVYALANISKDTPHDQVSRLLMMDLEQLMQEKAGVLHPYLCRLLDIPSAESIDESIAYYSPEALKEKLIQAFKEFVRAHAFRKHLVIEWEDLHWSDPSSLAMLESLISLSYEAPLIHLFVFRPLREKRVWEFHQHLTDIYQDDYHPIILTALSSDQSAELVLNLTRIQDMPDLIRHAILDRAEGNPFFIEELVRSLLDKDYLAVVNNQLILKEEFTTIDIPNTLQEVLTARIDNLLPGDKEVLQIASVVGRIFQHKVLKQLLINEELNEQMEPALLELQKRELIRFHRSDANDRDRIYNDLEYIFKHVITQEVTYNTILLAKRRLLHELTAATLESLFPDYIEEYAATLAFHYERAGKKEIAVKYLIKAADRARSIYANEEAISLYASAIGMLKETEWDTRGANFKDQIFQLQENMGDVFQLIAKNREAIQLYSEIQDQLSDHDRQKKARLFRKMGEAIVILQDYPKGSVYYKKALLALGQQPDASETAWWNEWIEINLDNLWLLYWQNLGDEMFQVVEEIEPKVVQLGTPSQVSKIYYSLCLARLRKERYLASEKTVSFAIRSAKALEHSGDLVSKGMALFLHGFACLWHDDYTPAIKPFKEALEITEKTGELVLKTRVVNYLAVLYRRMNDLPRSLEYTNRTLEIATKSKMQEYIGSAYANYAWIAFKNNKFEEVLTYYNKSKIEWGKISNYKAFHVIQWLGYFPVLAVYLHYNRIKESINIAVEIVNPDQKRLPEDLTQSLKKATVLYQKGDKMKAADCLKSAVHLAEKYAYM